MKTFVTFILMMCLASLASVGAAESGDTPNWVTVCPQDTGEALVNPDMGWTMHFYSNIPGNYVSIGDRDGTPQIALPLKHDDGHRRYRLGTLSCVKKD